MVTTRRMLFVRIAVIGQRRTSVTQMCVVELKCITFCCNLSSITVRVDVLIVIHLATFVSTTTRFVT